MAMSLADISGDGVPDNEIISGKALVCNGSARRREMSADGPHLG